ncbi:hypothetical protein [Flavobacterium sp.]|jgi:hypothetical protein|uniref:hypothetical protein n=1 Tax=Flavobacterium sp. TaxID=239 RepID=UPI00375240CB
MNTSYRFISDVEPTENELELLMKDVIIDVKERAKKANLKFKKLQKLQINQAIERQIQIKNGRV